MNKTFLILIPKKDIPESILDYKPTNLCSGAYKSYPSILANRLGQVLSKTVYPFQSAFVPSRSIHDILIAHEILISLSKQRSKKFIWLLNCIWKRPLTECNKILLKNVVWV